DHAAGCQRPSPRRRDPLARIQNISDVAQGPAVRSVIPWMAANQPYSHGLGTKRGEHAQMSDMSRREFITLLSSAAAWPLAARAEPPGQLPTLGFLGSTTPLLRANGSPLLCSACANSAGLRIAMLRSSTAGQRDALSASPRSLPSSPDSRSISLLR